MSLDTNMRILVVDDSSTMQRIVRTALKDIDLDNVVTADDGDQAWTIIERGNIDLVLSDHNMPGMSGAELLSKVRAHPDYKCTPFIMITVEAFRENVLAAIKLGVTDYIVKPFSSKQLQDKIVRVFSATC